MPSTFDATSAATGGLTFAVLVAAVLHATWNALTHAITDKFVAIVVVAASMVVAGAVALPWVGVPAPASWPFLLASAGVHLFYYLSLMRSFRLGAFNQVYPLARGMSPWVVAILAMLLVGEQIDGGKLLGVVVVSVGLGCLVFANGRPHQDELPAVTAAVLTGLLIAGYTVLDGIGVRRSGSAFGYAAWLFLVHGASLLGFALLRRGPAVIRQARASLAVGATAGACASVAYALVLWAQTRGSLAAVAALRETSVIVGALIGALAFREPFGRWRVVATCVVVAGIALLNLG